MWGLTVNVNPFWSHIGLRWWLHLPYPLKLISDGFGHSTAATTAANNGGSGDFPHETTLQGCGTQLPIVVRKVFEQDRAVTIDNGLQQSMVEKDVLRL